MKAIRLVNGHYDGETESNPGPQPREQIHRRLPPGEWVDSQTGKEVTHDVYHLTTDANAQRVYACAGRAIEKSTWLKVQELKKTPKED